MWFFSDLGDLGESSDGNSKRRWDIKKDIEKRQTNAYGCINFTNVSENLSTTSKVAVR